MGSEDFYSLQRAGCDQLPDDSWIGWHQGEIFKHHQPPGFNQSTFYVLAVSRGLLPGKKKKKTVQESGLYLYLSGNWEFGDSAMWQNYSLNCSQFPAQQLFFVSTS